MRRQILSTIAVLLPISVAGCGGPADGTAVVNLAPVRDRVVKTVENFDAYLRRYDYKNVDDAMYEQFTKTIQHDLNEAPRIHATPILTRLNTDASVTGFGDLNRNGKIDKKEPRLFKVEIDTDNHRVIVTAAADGTAAGTTMPRGVGFFAGVMIASLTSRQLAAGVGLRHFDKRKVAGAPIGQTVASKDGKKGKKGKPKKK